MESSPRLCHKILIPLVNEAIDASIFMRIARKLKEIMPGEGRLKEEGEAEAMVDHHHNHLCQQGKERTILLWIFRGPRVLSLIL